MGRRQSNPQHQADKLSEGSGKGDGVRPTVRLPRSGVPKGALIAGAGLAAILLFSALEARRRTPVEPAIWVPQQDARPASNLPMLRLPAQPAAAPMVMPASGQPPQAPRPVPPASSLPPLLPPSPEAVQAYYNRASQSPLSQPYATPPTQPAIAPAASRTASGSALVIDLGGQGTSDGAPVAGGLATGAAGLVGAGGTTRARSSSLANRANTVPQGTLIPAVLETAFDSTRPGFARAIVSRNVRGFDGSRVLIPRGSGLVGEYKSDAAPGQKRATITWTRLLRPDGVTIELNSPAVDPLGKGGVRASVNNHLPERVFGALLQSSFQIGTLLATRAASGSVVLALPGTLQGSVAPPAAPVEIKPTLKVAAGTSISIFVARDLEFGGESR